MFKWFRNTVQRHADLRDRSLKKCCGCNKPIHKGEKKTKQAGLHFHRHCWKYYKKS